MAENKETTRVDLVIEELESKIAPDDSGMWGVIDL